MVLIALMMRNSLGISAELTGDIVRVNGIRFFVFSLKHDEIFVPSDEFISEGERISQAFCRNHLSNEDVVTLRKSVMNFRDESLKKLSKLCKQTGVKPHIKEKSLDQSIKGYDHRNSESWKSIIDYLKK